MDASFVRKYLEQSFPYEPTAGQQDLLDRLSRFLTISWKDPEAVFILRGYAGTGKTTVVRSLVNVLPRLNLRTVLMAPTGRAAKVLSSYTHRPANTIHRKIYFAWTGKEGRIELRMQENKHRNTLFIIDEASMIQHGTSEGQLFSGRDLLEDLFMYVRSGENCRLMLIGDSAQLPPVGLPTSPALDLQYLEHSFHIRIETCELKEVVRQSMRSGALFNATRIRTQISAGTFAFPFFDLSGHTDVTRLRSAELEDELNTAFASSRRENSVVICRSNKRANLFNREIRRRVLYLEGEIAAGEYLMIVKNNYFWLPAGSSAGFIANGDIVELMRIRKIEELYGFRFAEVTVRFIDYPEEKELDVVILLDTLMSESASLPQADNNKLFQAVMEDYQSLSSRKARLEKVKANPWFNALQVKYAYALTCHKTQGGQWDTVFVDQGYLNDKMMNAEYLRWLYTAVTRTTKRLFLVNFEDRFFSQP
ncbi:MAG TPA: AAA family ATPase [Bacteroidales bacterium]|nr:AAA family ATPase [Bacteroidales bacterium]HPS74440.1 AAA family ATPase [Bacteroidales bacterium]